MSRPSRPYRYRKQMGGLLDFHGFREQTETFLNDLNQYKADDSNVVHRTGAENVAGPKTFAEGPYGTTDAVSASAIDLAQGVVFTKTISENTTFTISGAPTGKAATFNLILTNGGAATVTWPASVKWSGGNPPTLTASGIDVLTFLTPDGGTTWYGTVALGGAA